MKIKQMFGALAVVMAVVVTGAAQLVDVEQKVVSQVQTAQRVVALTIDDGPHYKTTPEILAILKAKNVRATFFVLGENVDRSPELLAREIADGHEIAIHSYHHSYMTKLDNAQMVEEFERTEKAISRVAQLKPALFRPPGGFYNEAVVATARQQGYAVVLWNIDTLDWTRPPATKVVNTVLKEIVPGSIILMHDGQYPLPTPKALGIIIDQLREQGYEFITMSELLRLNETRHAYW